MLNQIVTLDPDGVLTPGSGTFTETPFSPVPVTEPIFEYNAELHLGKEFHQKPDTVYWLKIVAIVDLLSLGEPRLDWGWHNRDYTIKDTLASTPPLVAPGEADVAGMFAPADEIWHFQDDAVHGSLNLIIPPVIPPAFPEPPIVMQSMIFDKDNYEAGVDGPIDPDGALGPELGIDSFSKDLAFELYTVPEPGTLMLVLVAFVGCGLLRKRRRV